jgi:hypothetical protein
MSGYDVNHSPALEGCRDRCARLKAENAELRAAIKEWAEAKEAEAELDSDTSRQHVRDAEAELFLRAALAATEGSE